MLFVTDPQGRKKDYIVVPAEWDSADLGRNLGCQIDRSIKHDKTSDGRNLMAPEIDD